MLVDGEWLAVPDDAIQYRALEGDTGETRGGHWCGLMTFGNPTYCAILPSLTPALDRLNAFFVRVERPKHSVVVVVECVPSRLADPEQACVFGRDVCGCKVVQVPPASPPTTALPLNLERYKNE